MANNTFIPQWLNLTVKVSHLINCIAVVITLAAYLAVDGGGIAMQFLLGCYQLAIAALATLAYWKWKIPTIWKLLKLYWIVLLAWVVCVGIIAMAAHLVKTVGPDSLVWLAMIVVMTVLPLLIACYFVYVTYCIYNTFKESNHE